MLLHNTISFAVLLPLALAAAVADPANPMITAPASPHEAREMLERAEVNIQ
jgi:hypothetical protein